MKHLLPELPYALDALAPVMSADTLNFHYGKHLQTYLDNVNRMIEGTPFAEMKLKDMITKAQGALYNNAAQAFNHIIFFKQLTPTPTTISPLLTQALVARFGSVDAFKSEFSNAAATLFGSGWVWLALDANNVLQIVPEPNAGNPITRDMRPLMCIDVWEHAYYLDYKNRRGDYIKNFWNLVNWDYIEKRMQDKNYQLYY
ncbi:superoxide dismutase [Prevotellamassilia timonensis]|uniref:superoxide dismutase n=1 Tax=Prevotellamassilia timonensis TaxID=1852370 RepID=UPI0023F24158|nr:superoxide dismutase [Prevotellamassilia timonensis]MDD7439071.1 superoxide dismutase [Prevotellamassilia timonensis]